jgi:hypothetical protein
MRLLVCLSFVVCIFSTCKKSAQQVQEVYRNTFEQPDLTRISGGIINTYDGSKVLGYYNDGGFSLTLDDLPGHELVTVSFDLYTHDTWGGNNIGDAGVADGPDLWQMKVDGDTYINTTFSNSVCNGVYCLQQSYPRNYPYSNDPGTGAARTDLPGVCNLSGIKGGTFMYKIQKEIRHEKGTLVIEFKDLLKQSNAQYPICDESWSLDNLVVTTSVLKNL